MSAYAVLSGGKVVNVAVCDDPTFATSQGWVGPVDTLNPQPCSGWGYDGTTWTAPTAPAPTSQQQAAATVAQLAATIPGNITQAKTDLAALQAMTPADLTTQAALDIHTRMVGGMAQLLDGLAALVQAVGVQ